MSEEIVYLVEATVYDPSIAGTRVLRYCTGAGYVWGGAYYEPRIKSSGRLKRAMYSEGRTSGPSQIGFGEVVLVNTDGGLDALVNYGFDGRTLMIRRALAMGTVLTAVVTLAACSMEQPTATWDEVAIRVKDRQQELNVPLQPNKYGGTNALPAGVDGTADIKGKPKPLLFGWGRNVTPVCVNTSRLIYQLHDGIVLSIPRVYDRGVSLTRGADYLSLAEMEQIAPAPGQFRTYPNMGMFRLGSSPTGVVTADAVEGGASPGQRAAIILERIARQAPTILSSDIEAGDISALSSLSPGEIGYYSASETTVAAALDQVAASLGAWYGFDAAGKFRVGRLDAPSGSPVATITAPEALSIERVPTNDEGRGLPVWRVNLGYDRNWTMAPGAWADSLLLTNWMVAPNLPTFANRRRIAYGGGLFIMIGSATSEFDTNKYLTSTDGVNWVERTLPVARLWYQAAYGNGMFVIMPQGGTDIYTSTDGINWTARTLPVSGWWDLGTLGFGGGRFIAVGASGVVVTSTDGITWTSPGTVLPTNFSNSWPSLAYGNNIWVLANATGTSLWTSSNGSTWTQRSVPAPGNSPHWVRVAFQGGLFLAINANGECVTSADGLTWTLAGRSPLSSVHLFSGDGLFAVVGLDYIAFSGDGFAWALVRRTRSGFSAWGYGNGMFLTASGNTLEYYIPAAGTDRAQWLNNEYRKVTISDSAVQTIHPLARELNIDTLLIDSSVAQTEANRLLVLYKEDRVRLKIKVPRSVLPADIIGKVVQIQIPRYGWGAGKLFLVIGSEEDYGTPNILLDLWG